MLRRIPSKVFLTKPAIAQAIAEGETADYNRQLNWRILDVLNANTKIPVMESFEHEHIGGIKVKPHVRLVFDFNGILTIDVSQELFATLPRA